MSFNTYPYSPFPASTEQLHRGDNEDLQAQIDAIEDGTSIDSFKDVENALELKADRGEVNTALGAKCNLSNIAPTFDAEAGVYAVGDQVIQDGVLYEFTSAHETAGDWDPSEVQAVKISDLIDTLKSGLTNVEDGVITPETGVTLSSYTLKKSINTVSINALVQLTPTLGSNNTVGVIPSEYRPSDRVYITCVNSTSDKLVIGFIDKYGGIYIYPTSNDSAAAAQNYYISVTFVVS